MMNKLPTAALLSAALLLHACGEGLEVDDLSAVDQSANEAKSNKLSPSVSPKPREAATPAVAAPGKTSAPASASAKPTQPAPAPAKTTAPAAPTYALQTATAKDGSPEWKSSFSLYGTYTIFIATEITGSLPGHHAANVTVLMPGGAPYQSFDVAFATDVPAYPYEQQAEPTANGWRVWVELPVAGTVIQQANLAGEWSAELRIDGAASPNATAGFLLQ